MFNSLCCQMQLLYSNDLIAKVRGQVLDHVGSNLYHSKFKLWTQGCDTSGYNFYVHTTSDKPGGASAWKYVTKLQILGESAGIN